MNLPQEMSSEDKKLFEDFTGQLKANGLTDGSVENYRLAVQSLAKFSHKPCNELTREDIMGWCNYLNNNGYSEGTVSNYKQFVRRFLKWIHTGELNKGDYPECISWMKIGVRRSKEFRRQILTAEEVKAMMDSCENQRDRAMIHVGYESGCRAGELLGLDVKDVEFDRYGAVIKVNGKTGFRRIRLVLSVGDLKLWLSMYSQKDDQNAPLWWSRNHGRLTYQSWYRNLLKIAKRAEIKKDVTPHLLRHSRATHLAAGVLTEAQMREFFGWTKSSNMPEVYVHLSGRDVDNSILKHYGIKVDGEASEKVLYPRICPYCKIENSPSEKFCQKCNSPLDPVTAEDARKKDLKELVKEMVESEEFRELVIEGYILSILKNNPRILREEDEIGAGVL